MAEASRAAGGAEEVRNLLGLPDETFKTLVESNAGDEAPPRLWGFLLHPDLVRRTHSFLSTRFTDVEGQLAQARADMEVVQLECAAMGAAGRAKWAEANAEHQEWRRRALGYRRLLSKRLAETKRALPNATNPRTPADRPRRIRLLETVFRLAWAIHEHRETCLRLGIAPDDQDVALWRSLDRVELATADGPITVATFLADIAAKPGFRPPEATKGQRPADELRALLADVAVAEATS